jgi:hypothetical protein
VFFQILTTPQLYPPDDVFVDDYRKFRAEGEALLQERKKVRQGRGGGWQLCADILKHQPPRPILTPPFPPQDEGAPESKALSVPDVRTPPPAPPALSASLPRPCVKC